MTQNHFCIVNSTLWLSLRFYLMLQKYLLYEEIRFPLTQTANPEISLQPADIPIDSLLPTTFIQSKFKIIHAL